MAEDFREMAASVNTQLRFGRHRDALREAYRLRLHLQVTGHGNEEAMAELVTVEEVIEQLERRKSGSAMRLILLFLRSIKDAFERSEQTSEVEPEEEA